MDHLDGQKILLFRVKQLFKNYFVQTLEFFINLFLCESFVYIFDHYRVVGDRLLRHVSLMVLFIVSLVSLNAAFVEVNKDVADDTHDASDSEDAPHFWNDAENTQQGERLCLGRKGLTIGFTRRVGWNQDGDRQHCDYEEKHGAVLDKPEVDERIQAAALTDVYLLYGPQLEDPCKVARRCGKLFRGLLRSLV